MIVDLDMIPFKCILPFTIFTIASPFQYVNFINKLNRIAPLFLEPEFKMVSISVYILPDNDR